MKTKLFPIKILEMPHKALFLNQWYLMFHLDEGAPKSFSQFKAIIPPKDRFWADPHVIQANSHYYIFIEEYIYQSKKGYISVIEMDCQGNWRDPIRVLERDYHLSYPFVFEWEGRYYMVPESADNKTIELYECIEFPRKWKFKMNLMENVNAVDTTLFYHGGNWWLFTGIAENQDSLPLVQLFLFFSTELLTCTWNSHPLNPIVPDVFKARPAGAVFTRNGSMFRPSQDCSRMYGYGFDLNEILLLSDTEYLERRTTMVRPDWDKRTLATHTFAVAGQLTVIDALMRRPRLWG
jgi:hypothetical protein